MKRKLLVAGFALLLFLVLALITLRIVGLEPQDRRPGLWIKGELVTTPIADWSFTDQFEEIYLETRYLASHSPFGDDQLHRARRSTLPDLHLFPGG